MINLNDVAREIITISKKYGCAAQVSMNRSDSKELSLRKGEVERLLTSVSVSTGVRLFKGNKSAIISFSGEDFGNLEAKIKTVLESIDYLTGDEYRRLLKPSEFSGQEKELDLDDKHYEQIDIPHVKEALKRIETGALSFSKKILPSDTADFSGKKTTYNIYTSEGLNKTYSKSMYSFSYTAVAEDKGLKERDSWSESKRHYIELPHMDEIGRIGEIAAEKAVKRLGGKKIKSGERKTVFSWRTADNLLDLLCDAMDGENIVLKDSFLVEKLGEKLFPDHIQIIDDPLMCKYIGSYPFDGEGMTGQTKAVVEKGKLATYLHNSYSAGKLNMRLTGNASHSVASAPQITVGNFYLQGGKGSLDDLLHEMKNGLLVEELYVSGINTVTGDFSFGCAGFNVEKGKITKPVKEITIAGNLLELYRNIVAVADDNPWRATITSPSIFVSKLTVAGT